MDSRINLNDKVKVKLTDYGREILTSLYVTQLGIKDYKIEEDEEGYYHAQVHALMNVFGKHLYPSNKPPFETDIVVY